ncbi:hypothetical protein M569_05415, partial [Genlisea aurea]
IPNVSYKCLPMPDIPPELKSNLFEFYLEIPRLSNPVLKQNLEEISERSKVNAIVIDVLCSAAFHVSADTGIPTYFCQTSGASSLAVMLYWPEIHESYEEDMADFNDFVIIPGNSPLHSSDFADVMQRRCTKMYELLMEMLRNVRKSEGIVVFSFDALEFRALEAIRNGSCVPGHRSPPVYPIGPLIHSGGGERHECLRWLDLQPRKSVVFLCFGRRGVFSGKQLREMADGLDRSGHRFLWAIRNPPEIGSGAEQDPEIEILLPEGFLERTKHRGFVVKSWAPQTAVLAHESVAGFVSHCGQGSILEAATFGVPIIGWPLYAEQRLNRKFLVEEARLSLPLEEDAAGFVTATELEKRVRELFETENGRELRRRAEEMKSSAAAAMKSGGSSMVALEKFMAVVT